jgi:hypothetical protein
MIMLVSSAYRRVVLNTAKITGFSGECRLSVLSGM